MLFQRLTPAFAPQTLGVLGCCCQVKFLSLNFQISYEDFWETANIIEAPYGVLTTYSKACGATCSHETNLHHRACSLLQLSFPKIVVLPTSPIFHLIVFAQDLFCYFSFTDIDSTFLFFINASQGPQK